MIVFGGEAGVWGSDQITYQISTPSLFCPLTLSFYAPPVLWRCWLSGRKGIRPVKTELWGADMVICLERASDLHMAQLMPLPLAVSCFSKIQIGFTFLVPAHPGSPGQRAFKRCVCVCACVRACVRVFHSRLKTFLFCKSFPPSFSSSGLTPRIPRTVYRYFWA